MNLSQKDRSNKPVMVVGGGIAGLYSALHLAEMNHRVILIEKSPALGGALPFLFRTYPECACCRVYGKMLEVVTHPNIDVLTLSEIKQIDEEGDIFRVEVTSSPRFVELSKCIACDLCAEVCPQVVRVSSGFQWGARKAAYMAYPQAVPYGYVIDETNCLFFQDQSCRECEEVCPTRAINLMDGPGNQVIEAGSIILAAGFESTPPSLCRKYGYQFPNVVTAMEFERLLNNAGPTQGKLLCPSNNTEPGKIAWIQCVGSRDTREPGCSHCSSVCCMHAIKEAINAKENLGEETQADIYYMDIRAFGKGFEEYYTSARAQNIGFKRSRIHQIVPSANSDSLLITYHNEEKDLVETEDYDLVVLSTGMQIPVSMKKLSAQLGLDADISSFIKTGTFDPVETSHPGVFVCGSLCGPKDIYDTMVEAAAAAECVSRKTGLFPGKKKIQEKEPVFEAPSRIGVFLCKCPVLGDMSEAITSVAEKIKSFPHVCLVKNDEVFCTETGRISIVDTVGEERLDRVVVSSCATNIHRAYMEKLFEEKGYSPSILHFVELNNGSLESLEDQLDRTISKASEPLPRPARKVPITPVALVVGGGISGMEYAVSLAEQDFRVHMVEMTDSLGGRASKISETWKGEPVMPYLGALVKRVSDHPNISIHLKSKVTKNDGYIGNFRSVITPIDGGEAKEIFHGVTHLATGSKELKPKEYLYGENPRVITLMELENRLTKRDNELPTINSVLFIQCVGSRESERPYCSRVCCTRAISCALKLKELNKRMNISVCHRDIRTYGLRENLYQRALASGVFFIRYNRSRKPAVSQRGDGTLEVRGFDPVLQQEVYMEPDMIVLSSATIPEAEEVSEIFSVDLDENGFFAESHTKMRPVQFYRQGLTMSGSAHGPKFMEESIAQSRAAAAHALSILQKDHVEIGGSVAVVDRGSCSVCCTCVRVCPFNVPKIEAGVSFIDEMLCQGCGACVAECPGKAISLIQYEDERIFSDCKICLSRRGE